MFGRLELRVVVEQGGKLLPLWWVTIDAGAPRDHVDLHNFVDGQSDVLAVTQGFCDSGPCVRGGLVVVGADPVATSGDATSHGASIGKAVVAV